MNYLSARTRIALGQCCLLASVLLVALALGIVPDSRSAVVEGRSALCEAIALYSSVLVTRNDLKGLESTLNAVVQRNTDILSAGVRRHDGKLIADACGHSAAWQSPTGEQSNGSRVEVPLRTADEAWGSIEVRFRPLGRSGVMGYLQSPLTRLVCFVSAASMLVFMLYLGLVLEQLDPSKVVPGRVRSALNTLAEGLLVLDKSGRIVLANDAFANLLGKPTEKLVGVRAARLPWVTDGESQPQAFPWTRAVEEQRPLVDVMMRLHPPNSDVRTFAVNCSPVLGHDGNYRGVLASFDDVTQIEQHKEEARAANRAKSDFLARMSHEIRTPMNAILGFTDVLRRGFDCDEVERHEYLNTIHASGQHLLNLINDILDLSKVEAGKLEVELVRCSPVQVITEVVSVLRVRAQEKAIMLESAVATEMPETILSDPVRLRQILMNLVGNAIKFTENGGVKVIARFLPSPNEPRIAFEVVDTGIGIPKESIAKIFDPFVQADTSVTRRFGGTGLGLAICQRFSDALGGELKVESEPGVGSSFTVIFKTGPLEGVSILDPKSAAFLPKVLNTTAPANFQLPPARVLAVDDGAENRKLLLLVLRRTGLQVVPATNGKEAVDLATREHFDLILMDIEMPIMDGYEAAATLRAADIKCPIIALTAHAMKGDDEKCRAAGFSGYLPKPIDMDQLVGTIAQELGVTVGRSPSAEDGTPCPRSEQVTCLEPVQEVTTGSAGSSQQLNRRGEFPAGQSALISTLPTSDPEFLEIVQEFVQRLEEKLSAMDQSLQTGDLVELARLAHWLKGSGGTAGFGDFYDPASRLERLAKEKRSDQIEATLGELRELTNRIVVPENALPALSA